MTELLILKQTDLIEQLRPSPACLALQHFADIRNVCSWAELLKLYWQLQHTYQPQQVLLLLEGVAQCSYTSALTSEDGALYFDEDVHFADFDAEAHALAIQNYELYALKHVQQQLQDSALSPAFDQVDWPLYYDLNDGQVLVEININPLPILDEVIQVKLVEASRPALSFAAMPNGYFAADLNPFQNFSLISHLEQNYGYALMGMGASVLVLIKDGVLSEQQLNALIRDLATLYHLDVVTQMALKQHIQTQDYLILSYIESLYELAAYYDVDYS